MASDIRTLRSDHPVKAQGRRLVALADLGAEGVVEVETDDHGTLAVGVVDGVPFATSNLCRHQFAKLGRGRVVDGCLECPWHRARYDVRDGRMVLGPQGRVFGFAPYSKAVQAFGSVVPLRAYDVTVRDGWVELTCS